MYYDEMNKFISIPLNFRGCRNASPNKKLIFHSIRFRHNDNIIRCYRASNDLFNRLTQGLEQYKSWFILGQVDVEELIEQCLNEVSDWEKNFRVLKYQSQQAEKLPKSVE